MASESLHDVTPVETWSSKAMGTSVAAYFLYNIRASNFFWGASNFKSTGPSGQWVQKFNVKPQGLHIIAQYRRSHMAWLLINVPSGNYSIKCQYRL